MKKTALFVTTVFAPLVFVNVAHADLALATSKGCTACHQVDKKVLGPAYNAVAACYANKDAKKLATNKAALARNAPFASSNSLAVGKRRTHGASEAIRLSNSR